MITKKYHIYGLVQGVGFRPFVAELARESGLFGYVKNDGGIVTMQLSGEDEPVDEMLHRLLALDGNDDKIPGARVDRVEEVAPDDVCTEDFCIVESTDTDDALRVLPPDIATCDRCVEELFDKKNRRYRHPFISCTACGPRYTIMSDVPYDRERTTMSGFPMCESCEMEYEGDKSITTHDKASSHARISIGNRYYAQTICCNDCGPGLSADTAYDHYEGDGAFDETISQLRDGRIAAVKDVGGYHLCFDAFSYEAAGRLREWKHREAKPFAVMFRDIDEIRKYAIVSETEAGLLTSPEAPIVLLPLREDFYTRTADRGKFTELILGGSNRIGAFLPSNPLQHLLLHELSPLVMTSGNRGGEPIITDDDEMRKLLPTGVPDIVLSHDRDILYGLDDSIYQVTETDGCEVIQILRRARGLVPQPVYIERKLSADTFAAGGDLKSVFALGRKNAIYLSGHFGDLIDARCAAAWMESISHFKKLLGITPEQSVCDKHPGYVSSSHAGEKVQHHYAHIMSVAAEHAITGRVLGVAYDGTGYGDDGTIWGGEFLLCDMGEMTYERVGHLLSVPLVGGDDAARDAEKTALSYLYGSADLRTGIETPANTLGIKRKECALITRALDSGINTVKSSSMGRLFDAAAAVLGICTKNSYEGECPMRLQYAAERYEMTHGAANPTELSLPITRDGDTWIADSVSLLKDLYEKKIDGAPPDALAYAFHQAVAHMTAELCDRICRSHGIDQIALSGGTMQNSLLLRLLLPQLFSMGYKVYLNHMVPAGDGGLALGQIYAAKF